MTEKWQAYMRTRAAQARMNDLLTCKELAFKLRKHVSYVYAMRQRGFKMPANRCTLDDALRWLSRHGSPKAARR